VNGHTVELDTSAERERLDREVEHNLVRLSWLEYQARVWGHRA